MEGPIDPQFQALMNAAMEAIDVAFNGAAKGKARKVGLVLLVFPFGETEGRANYISNGADRKDMVALFRETAARFEGYASEGGRA